ncbi:MAG: fluoride efflux transporter CrcB [Phototrophicales bacterium]|nr:MAG: fluoride efflux transporter CrcB [Phototrophicales bacterium]
MLLRILLVGVGGFIGANFRYLTSTLITSKDFPLATLVVNMVGCFGLALFVGFLDRHLMLSPNTRLLIGTGFFGALTTFSTFSFETINLIERGDFVLGGMYALVSTMLGFSMTMLGLWVGRLL